MADFARLFHFERFVPHLANNRELPEREQLALEIATGLSVVELEAFEKAQAQASADTKSSPPPEPPGKKATTAERAAYVAEARVWLEKLRSDQAERLAPLWAPFIRLAPGKHSVNGTPLTSLADYLRLVLAQQGLFNYLEISKAVAKFNSVDEAEALFSLRPFGGSGSTDDESNGPEGKGAADR